MDSKRKKAQVVVAVIDDASHSFSFLLLQTNEKRGSFWQNVTGKLDGEETYEEGGLREAIEETNLDIEHIIDILDLGLSYNFTDQRGHKVHEKSFLIILDKKFEVKIDSHEHQAFKWVGLDEINDESVKFSSNLETIRKAQNILKHWGR